MKLILIPLAWLMVPVAFIVLAYDIAKAWFDDKAESILKEKQ